MSAAASLTGAFTKMGADFQKANPGTTVTLNFGGSGTLVTQIQGGAPADVFASADGANMQKVVNGGQVTAEPTAFATNLLTIVTKPGNPQGVKSLADLAKLSIVSLCAPPQPCGTYADQILTQAGVTIPADHITRGADVKSTLAAVTTGDADAAIVYVTDAKASGTSVAVVPIPAWQNAFAIYPIAPIAASSNADLADAWIDVRGVRRGAEDPPELRVPAAASRRVRRRGRGVPLVAVLLALVAVAFFVLPLVGLLRQVPWGNLWDDLQEPAARDAIRLSIECSLWSTFFSLLFGVPLAYVLARSHFPGRALVRALVILPMVLPPVVGGVALLYAFRRTDGLVGGLIYDLFDFQFTFSKWGVVLAETFVAMPFLVITVGGRVPVDGPSVRGRRRQPRRRTLDRVPSRHPADGRARAHRRAPRWRGPAPSVSSAPRSRSPATSRAAPRRRPSRSTCSWRRTATSPSR